MHVFVYIIIVETRTKYNGGPYEDTPYYIIQIFKFMF